MFYKLSLLILSLFLMGLIHLYLWHPFTSYIRT
jgi:hypothetical protein